MPYEIIIKGMLKNANIDHVKETPLIVLQDQFIVTMKKSLKISEKYKDKKAQISEFH